MSKTKINLQSIIQNKAIFFSLLFLIFCGMFFFSGEKVRAEDYVCQKKTSITGGYISYNQVPYTEQVCKDATSSAPIGIEYKWVTNSEFQTNAKTKTTSKVLQNKIDNPDNGCSIWSLDICLLTPVMWFTKVLFIVAASLFGWVNNVNNIHYIINNNSALYTAWTTIRDILNLVFILVLLYSAFCTIFQISKYNYKKILLTLIIMALLVNFSFPIARFIIDASNVMMYDIIKNKITPNNFSVYIGSKAGIGNITNATYTSSGMMLTAIVFVFILAITLLAVAVLLLIRMIALAIIIIFSPLGFVGNIMPGFEKYAGQWWDNLFKYAFFGPIMMLGLYIAISVMEAMVNMKTEKIMTEIVGDGITQVDPSLIGKLGLFAIPIVILWMTMGLAQSMSIAGASTVMGYAQKTIKAAGKKFSGMNWINKHWKDYKKVRDDRKEAARWKPGKKVGEKFNSWQDSANYKIFGSKKARLRNETETNKKIDEASKLNDTTSTTDEKLQDLANSGNKFEKAAAIFELASRKLADGAQLNYIRKEFGEESQITRKTEKKMLDYRADDVFTDIHGSLDKTRATKYIADGNLKIEDQSIKTLKNIDFMKLVADNKGITVKNAEKIREKSVTHRDTIKETTEKLADYTDPSTGLKAYHDMANETHRTVQILNLSQNGKLASHIDNDKTKVEAVFKHSSTDDFKNATRKLFRHIDMLAKTKGTHQVGKIVTDMKDKNTAHDVARAFRDGKVKGAASNYKKYFEENQAVKNT